LEALLGASENKREQPPIGWTQRNGFKRNRWGFWEQ